MALRKKNRNSVALKLKNKKSILLKKKQLISSWTDKFEITKIFQ